MMMQPLNILFFICHDLGRELGCYGAGIPTPHLDAFAAEGVQFTNAFCNSPCCSPSRGCVMTGQYAHTNGLMGLVNGGWSLPLSAQTIVDHLNAFGYETAHFGTQHERADARDNRYQVEGSGRGFVEDAVDEAIAYLETRTQSHTPFYLNVGTPEVHMSKWHTVNEGIARRPTYSPPPDDRAYVPPYLPDVPPIRHELAGLSGAVHFLDTQIQRLFEALDRLDLRDNTLVVFTTDHGISGERAKGWLYDPGVATALLMRLPGVIAPGKMVDHLIQNIDLTPTLLEAVGAPIPAQVQGRSCWPLLCGGPYQPHEAIFTERNYHGGIHVVAPGAEDASDAAWEPMRAVRTRRFHYIRNLREGAIAPWRPQDVPYFHDAFTTWYNELWPPSTTPQPREELYDVVNDPCEWQNLADDPAFAATKEDLAARLDRWMIETDDPILQGPVPVPCVVTE